MIGNFRLPITTANANDLVYTRPTDWLSLPSVVSGDQKAVLLHAVFDHDSNFCALQCASNYTVDWGDGLTENFAANVSAYHKFTYSNHAGTESAKGYRQSIITITPQATFTLTKVDLGIKHNQTGLATYASGVLDVKMAGASISTLFFSGTVVLKMMEQFNFIGANALTNGSNMFQNCVSLQNIVAFYTTSMTLMNSTFQGCSALKTILLIDTQNVTSMVNMFYQCYALVTIPLLNTIKVTVTASMFQSCYSLVYIPFINTANVTNFSGMFRDCYSFKIIPLINMVKATNISLLLYNCYSLQSVPLFNTIAVTDCSNMFGNCVSLVNVPLFVLSLATNTSAMFSGCSIIKNVPALNFTVSTNMSTIFSTCPSLAKISIQNIGTTFSVDSCGLSQSALVEIFNNLKTIASKTITITNNWGASLLTAAERAIATNKGWTIVG